MINPTLTLPFLRGGDAKCLPLNKGEIKRGPNRFIIMLVIENSNIFGQNSFRFTVDRTLFSGI